MEVKDNNIFEKTWHNGWEPRDTKDFWTWAEKNLRIPHSVRTPLVSRNYAPWIREPCEKIVGGKYKRFTIMGPVQSSKTTIFELLLGWIIKEDPGNTMFSMQSDDDAKFMAESRASSVIESCEEIRKLFPKNRHKKRVREIIFSHMFMLIQGANINNLQSKTVRWVLNDEVWKWGKTLLEEAKGRVTSVWNSMVVNVSQGGEEGDQLDLAFKEGDMAEWNFQCLECGCVQEYKWKQVKYDKTCKDENGFWDYSALRKSVRYVCTQCKFEYEDKTSIRRKLSETGRYISTNTKSADDIGSCHYNSMTVWWIPWKDLVDQWVKAMDAFQDGNLELLKIFVQKKLGESFKPQNAAPKASLIGADYTKDEYFSGEKIWEGEAYRCMTIDKQLNHYWAVVRIWRSDGSSRLIWEGKLLTDEMAREVQLRLKVQDGFTFIDAQHNTPEVYASCARFGWTAIHGSGNRSFKHYPKKGKPFSQFFSQLERAQVGDKKVNYLFFATDGVKDILARLRAGRGVVWEICKGVSEDYLKQIDSESKREVVNKQTRATVWRWVKFRANHLWDCECMQVVFALIFGLIGGPEVEEIVKDEESQKTDD